MRQDEWIKYLDPEEEDLMEAEALLWEGAQKERPGAADVQKAVPQYSAAASRREKRLTKKRWLVLFVACMLTAAFGVAAAAASRQQSGWLASYFQVSDEKTEALWEQMGIETVAAAEDAGYRIEAAESISDGSRIYALLKVTAPEGIGFDGRQYALAGTLWKADGGSGSDVHILPGGGYIEDVGRPAQNQADFLFVWNVNERIKGKRTILKITEITAYTDQGIEETVAQGQWELALDIPEAGTKVTRCRTKVRTGEDIYYVRKIEVTPLGIRIYAVKAVPVSNLWRTAVYAVKRYVFHQNPPLPEGWGKESFEKLPVTAVYRDGSTEQAGALSHTGRGFSCEKSASFGQKKLVDPAEIQEIRLGDTVLKIRE